MSVSPNQQDLDGNFEEKRMSRSRSRSPIRRSSRSRSRSRSPRGRDHRDRTRRINLISKRCIISNVPYEMKWQDIKDIFRKEVGEVSYVEMWENPDGKSRGAGIIEFKDKDTARKAIEVMHRYKMKDRNIVVREERESDRNQMGGMGRGGSSGGGGGNMMGGGPGQGMMGNMSGGGMAANMNVSPQLLNQLGIEGPVSNSLFVSNLDYKVTWKKLKDVFKLAGNVLRAEIKQDKEGKSRGIGTVVFEFPMEAVQAVSMFNNQTLFDRPMRVKMDTPPGSDRGSSRQMSLPSGLKSVGMGLGAGGQPVNMNQMNSNMQSSGFGMGGGSMNMGTGNMGMGTGNMGMGGGMDSNTGMMGMGGGGASMGTGMGGMGGNMGTGMSNMGMANSMGMNTGMTGTGNMGGMGGIGGGMGDGYSTGMGGTSMTNSGYNQGSSMSGGGSMGMDAMRGMGSSNYGMSSGLDSMGGGQSMGNLSTGTGGYGSGLNSSYSSSDHRSMSRSSGDRDRSDRSDRGSRSVGTRPDNCTVVVKNLPWALSWQNLRDKFRGCADVKYAEIKMENGKSQGWGLVRFGSAEDAQQAISMMNRTRIDGREIDVKLYR